MRLTHVLDPLSIVVSSVRVGVWCDSVLVHRRASGRDRIPAVITFVLDFHIGITIATHREGAIEYKIAWFDARLD